MGLSASHGFQIKGNGDWRPCGGYPRLNDIIYHAGPLPYSTHPGFRLQLSWHYHLLQHRFDTRLPPDPC